MTALTFRDAMEEDCALLYAWANDPDVRASSFSPEPILWENHVQWFKARLSDPACTMYIAEDMEGASIGQVRFTIDGTSAEVDVHMAPDQRGKGYGGALIAGAVEQLFGETKVMNVSAFVKTENQPSIRAFEKAEFMQAGTTTMKGCEVYHFLRKRTA